MAMRRKKVISIEITASPDFRINIRVRLDTGDARSKLQMLIGHMQFIGRD